MLAQGGGVGANAPKNTFAGILMVSASSNLPMRQPTDSVCSGMLHCFEGVVDWMIDLCVVHSRHSVVSSTGERVVGAQVPSILKNLLRYSYDTGIISGIQAMQDWLCTFGQTTTDTLNHPLGCLITTSQQSLVVSILSVGTFTGALIGAPAADILGRRLGIVFSAFVFSIGVAMQVASTALPLFIVGRVIAGLGVGLVSVLVPMYQSEW